jgi:NADPH:quinone reductase-like Zn-dependent oxidoreductase
MQLRYYRVKYRQAKHYPKDTNNRSGTGGCSFMTALICLAAGIKPIITSSSNEKLDRLKELSPVVQGINYNTSDVKTEVLKLTGGKGVNFVLNNIGISSIPEDLELVRKFGSIVLVGFLEGFTADFSPNVLLSVMTKACKIQ